MPRTKRKDKSRVVLRTGESQRADGTYHFSWTDANHKRRYVYAKTLDELRYKEEQIAKDKSDGIKAEARYTTVNDIRFLQALTDIPISFEASSMVFFSMMICFTSQKFSFPNTVVQYIARSTLSSDISDGICAAAVIIIKRLLNFV